MFSQHSLLNEGVLVRSKEIPLFFHSPEINMAPDCRKALEEQKVGYFPLSWQQIGKEEVGGE